MLLASAISERQDTAAFLRVFAKALRNFGAPEAVVTDGGGIFYSLRSLAIYEALDIRKERIDPGQPWLVSSSRRNLPVTWIAQNIFASAAGVSMQKLDLPGRRFRSPFTPARSK